MAEIARELSRAGAAAIDAETRSPDELVGRGQSPGWVETQYWLNAVGYPARAAEMERLGLAPTRFAAWADRHFS